jgi:hypothetical protein
MSCCGGQRARASGVATTTRAQVTQRVAVGPAAASPPAAAVRPPTTFGASPPRVYFRYVGATALTVFGPVTQTRYRFTSPGVTIAVDPRDGAGLAQVPHLQQVRR